MSGGTMGEVRANPTIRVGTDLVCVADIAASEACFGRRFLDRIYTRDEQRDANSCLALRQHRLAARFAAKEAVIKLLRPDQGGINWRDIEVIRQPQGWCSVELHGTARLLAQSQGLVGLDLSMSHENEYATATVVAQAFTPLADAGRNH